MTDSAFEEWLRNQATGDPAQLKPDELTMWRQYYDETRPTGSIPPDMLRYEFFKLGFQYYIAGRYAVAAALAPVAGNLLHHAVEMFLKGGLAAHTTEDERKRCFRHGLVDLWSEFKTRLPSANLEKFDPIIAALDKLEEIRYPENILKNGMAFSFAFGTETSVEIGGAATEKVPRYLLFVGEIDPLMGALCEASNINAKTFTTRYREPGLTYLKCENAETSLFE